MITRRTLLLGGAGALGLGATGAAGVALAPARVRRRLGLGPDLYVPDAAEGQVRIERVRSAGLGAETDLFTAVPAGHGDGAGLPVVLVLHGASSSVADFRGFGLGRFVTAAVERGAPPFVLAGTDDGPNGWVPDGSVDPQRMLLEELPGWLTDRGFDAGRRALWGWSRGGYGVLRLVQADPGFARAAALFSPAIVPGDPVFDAPGRLARLPLGFWCGTSDGFYGAVRDFVDTLPTRPEVVTYAPGAHTQTFWNEHTLAALAFLGTHW